MALTKVSYSMITGAPVNVLDFGADNTGATNCSTQVAAAYAYAITNGGELYFPPGTYLGQFVFSGEAPVRGAGQRRTTLKPSDTASYCVRLYGTGGDANLGATLMNLSITSTAGTGKGLEMGDRLFSTGCSNALVERVEVSGFEYNIHMSMCVTSTMRQVYSFDGTYGIYFDSEANVTTMHFDSCRFRTNDYGIWARTGSNITWTNCNAETNVYSNLWITTALTNGPMRWIFNTCWFENITGVSGVRACVFLDMQAAIAATKGANLRFNYCTISAPATIPDVKADRAQDVLFDHCAFSSTADAYTAAKFVYSTGTDAVRIRLKDCGTVQAYPTAALYASFPALTTNANGVFGFVYEFYNTLNIVVTNSNTPAVYQSGTFTPVIIGTTTAGAGTYGNQVGRYTKIANRVFFNLRLTWSAHTGTGNMNVSGLPFTILNASDLGSVAIYADGIALTASNYMMARLENGTTQIILRQTPTGTIGLGAVPLDTAGTLVISGQYEVA